jgi:tetratricopeptide (TPR) repeat protein
LVSNGELAGSLASMERASALDPRSPVIADNHAFTLLTLGRNADARARCEQALEFAPSHPACLQYVGMADLLMGDIDAARPMLERYAAAQNPSASGEVQELVDALAGRADRHALALTLSKLPFNSQVDADSGNALEDPMVAAALMMLEEHALALDYMERIAGNLGNTMDWAIMLPAMDPVRCEPRFRALVKQLKTTDPHFAKVCAGKS